jgi:hypothetical protein
MTATGISQEAEWVFLMSTLLQHDFILAVPKQKTEKHDAKRFSCASNLASNPIC